MPLTRYFHDISVQNRYIDDISVIVDIVSNINDIGYIEDISTAISDIFIPDHECQNGVRFMVTIVDDFSRATWTFLISRESQTLGILTKLIKMVSIHFHTNIQIIRSNNGTKFCNTAFKTLLDHHGIIHQKSCLYSSTKWIC